MASLPKIRWTDSQLRQLRRNVRAYNAARTRAIKGDPGIVDFLPPKLNVKDEMKRIGSRQELKLQTLMVDRELKYKFDLVTMTDGRKILRSEMENVKGLVEAANSLKKKIAKERGVQTKQPGRSGNYTQDDLILFRTDLENISARDWDKFVQAVADKSTREYYAWEDRQYKENYIEALWRNLGPTEETEKLVELVMKIPPKVMLKAAKENYALEFHFSYDWTENLISEVTEKLMTEWSKYIKL